MKSQQDLITLTYQIHRHIRRYMAGGSEPWEKDKVSPYQAHALVVLSKGSTMSALAAELGISLPSATSLVDRLVERRWVERNHDEDDRRVVRISVTAEGKAVVAKMKADRLKAMKFLLDAMPPEDLKTLERIFTSLLQTLENRKERN